MLTRNHRQELLCRAYVQAVAGRCGMGCSFRDLDYGIDATIHEVNRRGRRHAESGFKLDVQAKSTAVHDLTTEEVIYDIAVRNYDDLRDTTVGCARILVLLILPEDEDLWIEQSEDSLLLRKAAYWFSLRGFAASDNRRSVRLAIPRANVFSPMALTTLMNKIKAGGWP